MKHALPGLVAAVVLAFCAACSSSPSDGGGGAGSGSGSGSGGGKTDAVYEKEAKDGIHEALLAQLDALAAASNDLQVNAPVPAGRGWDATLDGTALAATRASWTTARSAYERVEGALAPLFPDLDFSIDARYDDFMTDLAPAGDTDLFDGTGVTGMHAIERVLYSDVTPARVVTFESVLPGYVAAAFPSTDVEATEFHDALCAQLVTDAAAMRSLWRPQNIDVAIAFQGLISLVNEQHEKVSKAASDEEESRYSQRTMADLRDNLAGTKTAYAVFRPWIVSKAGGDAIDVRIREGFDALDAAYSAVSGDAIPPPPATWSAENPTAADLATPFGQLYTAVNAAVDMARPDSVSSQMNDAAKLLGFPVFGP